VKYLVSTLESQKLLVVTWLQGIQKKSHSQFEVKTAAEYALNLLRMEKIYFAVEPMNKSFFFQIHKVPLTMVSITNAQGENFHIHPYLESYIFYASPFQATSEFHSNRGVLQRLLELKKQYSKRSNTYITDRKKLAIDIKNTQISPVIYPNSSRFLELSLGIISPNVAALPHFHYNKYTIRPIGFPTSDREFPSQPINLPEDGIRVRFSD